MSAEPSSSSMPPPQSAEEPKQSTIGPMYRMVPQIKRDVEAATKGASSFDFYLKFIDEIDRECTDVVFNENSAAWTDSSLRYGTTAGSNRRRNWRATAKNSLNKFLDDIEMLPAKNMSKDEKKVIRERCTEVINNPNITPTGNSLEEVVKALKEKIAKVESAEPKTEKKRETINRLKSYYVDHKASVEEQLAAQGGNKALKEEAAKLLQKCEDICFLQPQRDSAKVSLEKISGSLSHKRSYDEYEGAEENNENLRNVRDAAKLASGRLRTAFDESKEEQLQGMLSNPVLEDAFKLEAVATFKECREKKYISDDMWAKLEPEIERIMSKRLEGLKEQYRPLNKKLRDELEDIDVKENHEKLEAMRKLQEGENSIVKQLEVLDKEIEACGKEGVAFLQKLKETKRQAQ